MTRKLKKSICTPIMAAISEYIKQLPSYICAIGHHCVIFFVVPLRKFDTTPNTFSVKRRGKHKKATMRLVGIANHTTFFQAQGQL